MLLKLIKINLSQIKAKLIELASQSTSHGLPKIFLSQHIILKVVWFILFLVFSGLGIWKVIDITNNYLAYQVVTNIDVNYENSADFPTITFYSLKNSRANFSIQDILAVCTFNRETCNSSYFETIRDEYGFVSYRFKKIKTYLSGMENGLQIAVMDFNFNQGAITEGYKVIVHNDSSKSRYRIGFSNEGIYVSPGFLTAIAVNRVFSSKLGEPYNECLEDTTSINSYDSELYRYIIQNTSYSYTQKDCIDFCIGREMYRHYNITNKIDPYYIVWASGAIPNIESLNIYYTLVKGSVLKICVKECPLECDTYRYDITTSFTRINFNYSNNFVLFRIYYNDLSYTSITQVAQMDFSDYISNIGGILGLFIGVSFLSFAELLELLLEILIIIFQNNTSQNANIQVT